MLWAINENIICDYAIQTIITNEEQLEEQLLRFHIINENDKRMSLFVVLLNNHFKLYIILLTFLKTRN